MVTSLVSVLVFVLCCWHAKASSFTLDGTFKTGWGTRELCPRGTWAVGFKTKVELIVKGDSTAMNGIGLICGNKRVRRASTVTSDVGDWGTWQENLATCMGGFTGARLKVEKDLGKDDDSGTNSVRFMCKSGRVYEALNGGKWGSWKSWGHCPGGSKIIGIQTMVEPQLGSKGDDSALNSVRFFCGK